MQKFDQAKAIRRLKAEFGLTQVDIAFQCNVTQGAVSAWARCSMRFEHALMLCAANSITLEQFIKFGEE